MNEKVLKNNMITAAIAARLVTTSTIPTGFYSILVEKHATILRQNTVSNHTTRSNHATRRSITVETTRYDLSLG